METKIQASERLRRYAYAGCLERVLRESGVTPAEIGVICADGKGLSRGDLLELRMLEYALGPVAPQIPVTCSTSVTGVISVAGVLVNLILCLEMMQRHQVSPIAHLEQPEVTALALCQAPSALPPVRHALIFQSSLNGFHAAVLLGIP